MTNKETVLENILNPYKNNEYIPIHIIPSVLKATFSSCEIIHSYSETHILVKIKMNDFLSSPIANWQYNRPPDLVRCQHIAQHIYNSKSIVETMFYLSFNNKKCMYDVIDGIHRITALKIIQVNNAKKLDLLDDYNNNNNSFGNDYNAVWFYESFVIVNIRFNSKEGELIDFFKDINKSNPVPDIYVRDASREKKEIIETLANDWQIKYSKHFSHTSHPNKPNINRDRFIDLLSELYERFHICPENKHILQENLEKMNIFLKQHHNRKKITPKIIQKCNETKCWLFICSCEEILNIHL